MRGALSEPGVTHALLAALAPTHPAPDQKQIASVMYALARANGWAVSEFRWRPIHCTFHSCFVRGEAGAQAVVIGADAPVLALSQAAAVGDVLRFANDAGFAAAAAACAPDLAVLDAAELTRDLSDADEQWLVSLGPHMAYNLKYWRPQSVGDVIFNTWD